LFQEKKHTLLLSEIDVAGLPCDMLSKNFSFYFHQSTTLLFEGVQQRKEYV
jgi:hypothetical protein